MAGVVGGLVREWSEEIAADFTPEFDAVGLLNDDDNSVGAVHLGLVYAADAGGRPVAIRETDKLSGRVRDLRRSRGSAATGSRPGAPCCSISWIGR